jgi:hypothetical protein
VIVTGIVEVIVVVTMVVTVGLHLHFMVVGRGKERGLQLPFG